METRKALRLSPAAQLAALLLLSALPLAATPAEGIKKASELCSPYWDELIAKGKAVRASVEASPNLLPQDPSADPLRAAIVADKPGILVESAFFLPRPAPADQKGRKAELAAIYGLLRSFSSLEGIQYYSATHKEMRTLYAESYRINDPEAKARLPDQPPPSGSDIPAAETLYAFQRDLSFGANIYSYAFASYAGALSAEITNLTRMSYSIIPLIAPKALKMRLLVIQASDGIVFYIESDSSSPGPFRSKLEDSFANRAAALFAWFSAKSAFIPR